MEFIDLRNLIKSKFDQIQKSEDFLFYKEIDRNKIWEVYLNGFPEGEIRQSYNCNCCKSFLRQYGGIVYILNGYKFKSILDVEVEGELKQPIKNVVNYINSLPVTNLFLSSSFRLGTDKTVTNKGVTWNHFYIEVDKKFVYKDIPNILSFYRDNYNSFKLGVEEITLDAVESVIELIEQGSLYRGNEFKGLLQSFHNILKSYKETTNKEVFLWSAATNSNISLCRIRGSVIGSLLKDLSEGRDFEEAVDSFGKKVDPLNYKRPTSLVTPKMIDNAKKLLQEKGLIDSLERKYATEININNVLFSDKLNKVVDVFDTLKKEVTINPKSFNKIEEISIEKFITDILPKSRNIRLLLENKHLNNFVSLITTVNNDAPNLFKWDNPYSWSYTNGVTDSIKEKVKKKGGEINAELRISLAWNNYDDLDLHVIEPNKERIWFKEKMSSSQGYLDVDENGGGPNTRDAVENIRWCNKEKMREGKYVVLVNQFNKREVKDTGYEVEIECNGQVYNIVKNTSPSTSKTEEVISFTYSKTKGITLENTPNITSPVKQKWGLNTNSFHRVRFVTLSPNFWNNKIGNKHYFFFLENCISDEEPRGFYNEFLSNDLIEARKALELLGNKIKVEGTEQLSGIGFSETQRNSVLLEVEGSFKRVIKVIF